MTEKIRLMPHHIELLIEYYNGRLDRETFLGQAYPTSMVDKTLSLCDSLIANSNQTIEILSETELEKDTICGFCSYKKGKECELSNHPLSLPKNSDRMASLRYGLESGIFTVAELLKRERLQLRSIFTETQDGRYVFKDYEAIKTINVKKIGN